MNLESGATRTGTSSEQVNFKPPAVESKIDILLIIGTCISGLLVLSCIAGAMWLCLRVLQYVQRDAMDVLALRLLMSCIACFIAMGFGCLGFGLFLIRAGGAFKAQTDGGALPKGVLESNAPGLIVIVCATTIMWMALRVRIEGVETRTTTKKMDTSIVSERSGGKTTQKNSDDKEDALVEKPRNPMNEGVIMP